MRMTIGVDGISVPMKRRVYSYDADKRKILDPVLAAIDVTRSRSARVFHSMRFTSFEVNDVLIRTKVFLGILTAAVRSTAVRDGVEIKGHARQLAIVSKENETITISHFQSTNISDPK